MSSFYYANAFLINTLFSAYLYVLAFRLAAAFVQMNYFNSVMRFIIILTQPIVTPLRKVVPNIRQFETATFIWILIFEMLKIIALSLITFGMPTFIFIGVNILTETVKLILNTYFYAILVQAILSWVQQTNSPVGEFLTQIVQPVLRPLRRVIPPIGGVDITPIPALLILQFIIILIS